MNPDDRRESPRLRALIGQLRIAVFGYQGDPAAGLVKRVAELERLAGLLRGGLIVGGLLIPPATALFVKLLGT